MLFDLLIEGVVILDAILVPGVKVVSFAIGREELEAGVPLFLELDKGLKVLSVVLGVVNKRPDRLIQLWILRRPRKPWGDVSLG